MALWHLRRVTVKGSLLVTDAVDCTCEMIDKANGQEAVHVAQVDKQTYQDDPDVLLTALTSAGYSPNDWGGL